MSPAGTNAAVDPWRPDAARLLCDRVFRLRRGVADDHDRGARPRIDRHRSRPHGLVLFPRPGGMGPGPGAFSGSGRHAELTAAKSAVARHAANARPQHQHSAAGRDALRARAAAGIRARYTRAIYRRADARAATDAAGEAELRAHRPHFAALPPRWHGLA